MPLPPDPATAAKALLAENEALRAEVSQLREQLAAAPAAHQSRYEQSQVRFRTVFENSPLGQKIITPDLVIRQVNAATVAMLGFTQPDELVGRKILDFAHPERRADWAELQVQLWKHRVPAFSLETQLVRADGTAFWCQVHSVLFPDDGHELGYTILEDISGRKNLEERLQRSYGAQETMLQLATHDLKGPIAHIELLADLLQREMGSRRDAASPAEAGQYFTLMQDACNHARALLDDVLYVGDLDQHSLEKTPVDLPTYLAAQLSRHALVAQTKGLALRLDLPPEPLAARLHPEKFGRVLDNLLHNALKFTPAGGTITLGARAHAGKVRFTVQDTGIGIPVGLHAHLFDKFNPARRAGLHGETTTGLGLYIARQLVGLHGGTIWLESYEREGTTFFIELP